MCTTICTIFFHYLLAFFWPRQFLQIIAGDGKYSKRSCSANRQPIVLHSAVAKHDYYESLTWFFERCAIHALEIINSTLRSTVGILSMQTIDGRISL